MNLQKEIKELHRLFARDLDNEYTHIFDFADEQQVEEVLKHINTIQESINALVDINYLLWKEYDKNARCEEVR